MNVEVCDCQTNIVSKATGRTSTLPGYVFGDGYRELVHRCGIMCVPTEVSGTHPVIVEAMAAGACLLVSDHAPNVEVVGDSAQTFPLIGGAVALKAPLGQLVDDPGLRIRLREAAAVRAAELFSWDRCAVRYLELCAQVRRSNEINIEGGSITPNAN